MTFSSQKHTKKRADQWLVDLGLVESKSKAQALIMGGQVFMGERRIDKPGQALTAEDGAQLTLKSTLKYVSRGGLKLEHALAAFQVNPNSKIALDMGASTGGFTDCLLQQGAQKVYAVDVGYGQLDWKLRQDPRVVNLERVNIRDIPEALIPEKADLMVMDVSFISLKKVLPHCLPLLNPTAEMVLLIKPQFEYLDYVTPEEAKGFDGVIRDSDQREKVVAGIIQDIYKILPNWQCSTPIPSPIEGGKGNVEYLFYSKRP